MEGLGFEVKFLAFAGPRLECLLLTDAELVCAARRHDAEAWKTLYERHLPSVWRYSYALLGNEHHAEDVVGEVMFALLKGIEQIDTENPKISAWLRSVVRHKVADHHRRNYRIQDRLKAVGVSLDSDSLERSSACSIELAETRDQVLEILDSLSERQRLALELKYLEDLRVREIAERMGETEKAVEAILYRARREFRRRYDLAEAIDCPKIPVREFNEQATGNNLPPK